MQAVTHCGSIKVCKGMWITACYLTNIVLLRVLFRCHFFEIHPKNSQHVIERLKSRARAKTRCLNICHFAAGDEAQLKKNAGMSVLFFPQDSRRTTKFKFHLPGIQLSSFSTTAACCHPVEAYHNPLPWHPPQVDPKDVHPLIVDDGQHAYGGEP